MFYLCISFELTSYYSKLLLGTNSFVRYQQWNITASGSVDMWLINNWLYRGTVIKYTISRSLSLTPTPKLSQRFAVYAGEGLARWLGNKVQWISLGLSSADTDCAPVLFAVCRKKVRRTTCQKCTPSSTLIAIHLDANLMRKGCGSTKPFLYIFHTQPSLFTKNII